MIMSFLFFFFSPHCSQIPFSSPLFFLFCTPYPPSFASFSFAHWLLRHPLLPSLLSFVAAGVLGVAKPEVEGSSTGLREGPTARVCTRGDWAPLLKAVKPPTFDCHQRRPHRI